MRVRRDSLRRYARGMPAPLTADAVIDLLRSEGERALTS